MVWISYVKIRLEKILWQVQYKKNCVDNMESIALKEKLKIGLSYKVVNGLKWNR